MSDSAPTASEAVGFALTIPDSWFELDVRPTTRDANIQFLVESRVREQPELWEHRSALVKVLRRQARDAWDAGAVYCACFVMIFEGSVIPGSLAVSLIPPPPGGMSADAIAQELPNAEAGSEGDTWMSRSIVTIEGIGRVPRSQGVTDVRLPDGSGWIRTVVMRTFVPVDDDRLLLLTAASPAIDLVEPLLELFDVVTATLSLVSSPSAPDVARP